MREHGFELLLVLPAVEKDRVKELRGLRIRSSHRRFRCVSKVFAKADGIIQRTQKYSLATRRKVIGGKAVLDTTFWDGVSLWQVHT
jgi:hypothetical protein